MKSFRCGRPLLLLFAVLLLAGCPAASRAQTPLAFEVATIKPNEPGKMVMIELRVYPGGRLVIHGHSLHGLIAEAFNIPGWQINGGEKWVEQQRFDIEAKPPANLPVPIRGGEFSNLGIQDPQIRSILQALLIERFQLKFHIARKPGTVYLLQRGTGPLQLKTTELKLYQQAEDGTVSPSNAYPTGDIGLVSGRPVMLHQTSMQQLAQALSDFKRTTVKDETGLADFYNFRSQTLVTKEDFEGGAPLHLLVDAVPEMGLKLVKTDGIVEEFVIDHVEQPAAN